MDPTQPVTHAALRAWTQLVQAPLQALVIVVAVFLWLRCSTRDRWMLGWFIAGLVATLLKRFMYLIRDGEPTWFVLVDEGVLPTATSACFLVSMTLWWRSRGKP